MTDETQSTIPKWQKEHRETLARKGIEVPEEEPAQTFHCRRCHRDLPMNQYVQHYKACPGFASKCYDTCPPTGEPIDQSRKPETPGHE